MENKNTIDKVVDYIENNLEVHLSLDEIARKAGYSKFHLNRVFSETMGYTICKYIQMRRLTVAAEKLVYTQMPIVEIAFAANYNSQQSFTYAFHQLYGCPPQEYRAIKVHIPKLGRLSSQINSIKLYESYHNCEVMAA